ncbi:hypothetical protein KI387_021364, partial [Taxus chinensis]
YMGQDTKGFWRHKQEDVERVSCISTIASVKRLKDIVKVSSLGSRNNLDLSSSMILHQDDGPIFQRSLKKDTRKATTHEGKVFLNADLNSEFLSVMGSPWHEAYMQAMLNDVFMIRIEGSIEGEHVGIGDGMSRLQAWDFDIGYVKGKHN